MVVANARRRRGHVVTAASLALVAAALAVLATGLSGSSHYSERTASTAPARKGPANALYVSPRDCDDARSVADAGHAGTPWCTLSRAAEAAPAGSDVLVASGTYPGLTLSKIERDVTFRAQDPRARPLLRGITFNGVSGTTFSEFVFSGAVNLASTRDVTIRNNGFAGGRLYLRQTRGTAIIGNRLRHVHGGERALLAQGATTAGQPVTEDLLIRGNLFDDIEHDAIAVYNGYRNVTVEDNRIQGVVRPAGFAQHSDSMQFMGGDGLTVRGNILYRDQQGILVKDGQASTHLRIEDNLITDLPHGAGLQIFNAPGAIVRNNTIWKTAYGMILSNDLKVVGRTSVQLEANVLDQLIVNTGLQASLTGARGNVFGRGRFYGRPAYRGTPRFLNLKRGDLRIRAASPGAGLPRGKTPPGAQARVR